MAESFITQEIAPLQATTVEELRRETEAKLRELQLQIWNLRQYIQPGVVMNKDTPQKIFDE